MAILASLITLAALLVFAALGAFAGAQRISSNGRTKHWSGNEVSATERRSNCNWIRALRMVSGACALLAAADGIAIYTLLNYVANQ